jgi:hypothetical protein
MICAIRCGLAQRNAVASGKDCLLPIDAAAVIRPLPVGSRTKAPFNRIRLSHAQSASCGSATMPEGWSTRDGGDPNPTRTAVVPNSFSVEPLFLKGERD